jgi:carboxyl-terminal processing protease
MKAPLRRLPLVAAGLIVGLGIGIAVERWRVQDRPRSVTTAEVFQDVISAIRDRYVDSLTDEELYTKAARGVVSTLGDPYSAFLGPAEYGRYHDMLSGRGRSVGIRLEAGLTGLRVASVVPNGPADRLGLSPGDYLLAISGAPTVTMSPVKAAGLLRGEGGDSVRIRFRTPGDSIATDATVATEVARIPAATAPIWLTDSVAYVALSSVSTNASRDLREALGKVSDRRLQSLVLDLRGNGGGPLDEALAIADIFLAPGQRIGAVSKRRTRWATYFASAPDNYPFLKLSILVDRRTASSAEIIAAALRDNDRARLVGERTFGKGLIQTTILLGDSAALRLTTGRWEGPGGRLIAGGIAPDSAVVVPGREALLRRVLGREPETLAAALDSVVNGLDSTRAAAADSLALTIPERDLLRRQLRTKGIILTRQTMARYHQLFDNEFRRVAGAQRGNQSQAVRYSLLGDPVVAAGLVWARKVGTAAGRHGGR